MPTTPDAFSLPQCTIFSLKKMTSDLPEMKFTHSRTNVRFLRKQEINDEERIVLTFINTTKRQIFLAYHRNRKVHYVHF